MKGQKNRALTFASAAPDRFVRPVEPSVEMHRLLHRAQGPITPLRHQPATMHVPGSIAYAVLGGRVVR